MLWTHSLGNTGKVSAHTQASTTTTSASCTGQKWVPGLVARSQKNRGPCMLPPCRHEKEGGEKGGKNQRGGKLQRNLKCPTSAPSLVPTACIEFKRLSSITHRPPATWSHASAPTAAGPAASQPLPLPPPQQRMPAACWVQPQWRALQRWPAGAGQAERIKAWSAGASTGEHPAERTAS